MMKIKSIFNALNITLLTLTIYISKTIKNISPKQYKTITRAVILFCILTAFIGPPRLAPELRIFSSKKSPHAESTRPIEFNFPPPPQTPDFTKIGLQR
ncbi:hypothetical protein LRS11_02965 [Pseudomonas sp. J452]|uniref:hypothetical protein n=1 Tax=Pseudomonas sp. J452 TaxID=2898441 RepID=UPI0021ADE70C|nr:hypothetical protein [Pseudomonas sp. J452]UUY09010.1 hypothetical protein LRS11_02965 [Pseudomonas sp. J452]